MNKVFRVIWNAATQSWVAVSELTSAKGKTKSKAVVKMTALVGALVVSHEGLAAATAAIDPDNNAAYISISGTSSSAASSEGWGGVAIGSQSKAGESASEGGTVAIGYGTVAKGGVGATAIGWGANANAAAAVAIGSATGVVGGSVTTAASSNVLGGIAIGSNSKNNVSSVLTDSTYLPFNGFYSIAIGYASSTSNMGAMALGYSAQSNGVYGSALGPISSVAAKDSVDGLDLTWGSALGGGSSVTVTRGVALGNRSVADQHARTGFNPSAQQTTDSYSVSRTSATADTTVTETFTATDTRLNTYSGLTGNALKATLAGVSVGSSTNTRQINHVAAGYADDDAVNVAQLRSVNLKIAGNTVAGEEPSDGVESKADVLLDSQTLTVKSSDTTLLTTDATNNTITLTPNTQNVTVTSGAATTPSSNGLVTATGLATTLQNLYWTANNGSTGTGESSGSSSEIHAGDEVKLIAGDNVKITQSNGEFTFTVKDVVKTVDFNDDITGAFESGRNTTVRPITRTNEDGTTSRAIAYDLDPDISVNNVTITPMNADGTPNTNVTNYGTSLENGAVNGLVDHLSPVTTDTTSIPDTDLTDKAKKQAATVNDVLNTGWNLQVNNSAVDAVTHGNAVNFVSSDGSVLITPTTDGTTSTINLTVNDVSNQGKATFKGEDGISIQDEVDSNGTRTVTIGNDYVKSNTTGTAANAAGQNAVAIGGNSEANGTGSIAIGEGAQVTTNAPSGSVAIGPNSTADTAHSGSYSLNDSAVQGKTGSTTRVVSVGSQGDEAQIQNVAPGVVSETSTDAINGSQLYATNVRVNQNTQEIGRLNNNVNQNTQEIGRLNNNVNQNTQEIGRLNNKVDNVDRRASRGVAIAGAMGMLPQPHISGKSLVGVATTNYRGEQALAVGYSRLSDNGKHIIKLSGSTNMSGKKDAMVGAAYGFQW